MPTPVIFPQTQTSINVNSTSIASPESHQEVEVPHEYWAFQDVFSKQIATKLSSHQPWNCTTDLLPGAVLPKGRNYPLSILEQKATEEYIEETLAQGFIHPSTSPAASSFFVAKKNGGLKPCIDYRVLNSQMVKYRYPLPQVPSALVHLQGAQIFSKLDMRSAYNLIRMCESDEWKMAFITPAGHCEYLDMPCGLFNSSSIFQDFMNVVFWEYLH